MRGLVIGLVVMALMGISWSVAASVKPAGSMETIEVQLAKFKPTKINYDAKLLSKNDAKALEKLIKVSRLMDEIFLHQVWSGNAELKGKLSSVSGEEKNLADYFDINFGPFDRLNNEKAFIDVGLEEEPLGANYYPADMTKEEFNTWLSKHPEDRKAFESNFTVIRRNGDRLIAVPYSEEYKEWLVPAAKLMKEAAELTDNESLRKYLNSRAAAFLSNDYYQSDCDWMDLKDHTLEVVVGPYEVYEDRLFGYKAAFESFITMVDPVESKKLAEVSNYLNDLEANLPLPKEYQNYSRGSESPVMVVQTIYSAGDTKAGIQTIAFNLPNDERVREAKGSKKVMLKNVSEAKFNSILTPIAKKVMDPKDFKKLSFDAFFNHTLIHEVSHGVGPGTITVNGRKTTVNKELKDLYSVIEECKADTVGVYNTLYLSANKGMYSKEFMETLYPTYLAGIFRSTRFGINEAHGGGNIIQFNYLMEKGAFTYDSKTGRFGVNTAKMGSAIKDLSAELLMIEAKGDYQAARKFIEKYKVMPAEMEAAIAKLDSVPVDIKPVYAFK